MKQRRLYNTINRMKTTKKSQLSQKEKRPIFNILKRPEPEPKMPKNKVYELAKKEDHLGLTMTQKLTLSIILKSIWLS